MNLTLAKGPGTLLLAMLALAACQQQKPAADDSAPDAKPGIAVTGGMLVLPVVKGRPGAAYFTLSNSGKEPATLAAVVVDGAAKAEMHETTGGAMAPLPTVEVEPGGSVAFARGGKHVMVFDVADALKPGGEAEMTLTFSGGDKVSAPLRIEALGGAEER